VICRPVNSRPVGEKLSSAQVDPGPDQGAALFFDKPFNHAVGKEEKEEYEQDDQEAEDPQALPADQVFHAAPPRPVTV
jgi:hypothetical protein